MPKIIQPDEFEVLVDIVSRFPHGAGIERIVAASGAALSRRTLQRRLGDLVAQGRLFAEGAGRALKYRLPAPAGVPYAAEPGGRYGVGASEGLPPEGDKQNFAEGAFQIESGSSFQPVVEAYIRISPASEEIRAYVRRPLQGRRPVGYDIGFLEAYRPNDTWYLPVNLRQQLHAIGRSPAEAAPAGTFARDILNRLLIDLSWASSRLEGNTYSRLDTERLIRFGEAADGKEAIETQMILNHKAAIEYLVGNAERLAVNGESVVALHALLSDGLLQDPTACGRLRQQAVGIAGSVYLPIAMPQRVEELFGVIVDMAAEIGDPFEQAFFLMVHLPYLQPFEDVNKRVSRLAANIPLVKSNLSPLSFIDVPERVYVDALLGVYEMNRIDLLRDVFVWAYERSCQQYVAVKSQLVPPDAFRLRYRAALADTIRAIVRGDCRLSEAVVRRALPPSVAADDREAFVRLVLEEFRAMHPGNVVRFGLRPLEFEAWQAQRGPSGAEKRR